ncbi:class II fructose-1,6-bisphosphate aldolase [Oscillospiraceae bacterium MB08-C2-2]|nr:class II fructose-1,6-bisphosphate aldolase [Oscillospiraceae bacterium MB08-C2-2]
MLVTGKEILDLANQKGYAVGAFNVSNMEILQAVVAAAEEQNAPVILQTSQGAIKYAGLKFLSQMVRFAAREASVPIALHLDHGSDLDIVVKCIANGWTSVMIDGSHYSLEENIAVTKEVVRIAHSAGVSVEAELGRLSGVEEHVSVSEKDAMYTNPQEAKRFVDETGVDSLAIAIGTAHGKYKGVPKLDFDRLVEIKKLLNMPIVLHGSSGIPEGDIRKAVSLGVNKINIDTDLRQAFADGVNDVIKAKPDEYDTRKLCGTGRDYVAKVVSGKIQTYGIR